MPVRKQVETILPDAQVMDFKEGNPALSQGLDNATAILSLICLVAMVLGAIGVAMAMHAHLEQRMDMLAILKAVGARSSDLLRIFLLQTLGLGLAGGLIGVVAGVGCHGGTAGGFWQTAACPYRARFSMAFCTRRSRNRFADHASLLPAAAARCARSAARSGVAPAGGTGARRISRVARTLVGASIADWDFDPGVFALGGIAWALSDSVKVGGWFALLFTVALIVLLVLAAVALRVLRFALNRVRLRLPSSLRHGLANLYRPGNQSAAVLASLGTGVMLILAVYLMQGSLLRDIRETASPKLPNVFLIDVTQRRSCGHS